ncbi:hypothetical protein [Verminephrobacter aporrectodeae]|uniref:hypothetical protein n=1 Tax=Verminephrobacter aporrectodeae TaxID=1110389 RepID=UPI00023756D6|nr:hypothetical protein [Verminephrobacter aporrectodeae]
MTEFLDHLSANDNEIYDLLISGKQRLTVSVLREFARDRGIFYSPEDTREELADYLSLLPHDFHDIAGIVQKREPAHRREKTTFVRLGSQLSVEEMKDAVTAYANTVNTDENIVHQPKDKTGYSVNISYEEFNHTRTRLLQRERHEASIEFFVESGQTVVRLPATDKAKRVVAAIKETVEQKRKAKIIEETIELTDLTTPALRSKFFTHLISSFPGYKLKNVMRLKVSSLQVKDEDEEDSLDLEEDLEDGAAQEMFAAVHSMALSGENLVQSQEYKDLTARGFFITAITWRSEHEREPNDIIQFDAGFESRKAGTGFRYQVQGAFRAHKGTHRTSIVHVKDAEKSKLFFLIENTARKVLDDLLREAADDDPGDSKE